MELKSPKTTETDVLILGGGGAGLRAAIEAKNHGVGVLLASKSRLGLANNTAISGSGIAAGTGWRVKDDSPELHFKDTIIGGRYINDQRLVEVVTRESGPQVLDLERFGVNFRKREGTFHMALMAGHSYPRNAFGDKAVGIDLTLPLRDYGVGIGVESIEGVLITKLLTDGDGVAGAVGVDSEGLIHVFEAKATILATGGAGEIYLNSSNAPGSTGDGFVLAYDAGVPMVDMEFVQFSMTGPHVEMFCAREGAVIINAEGENILETYGLNDPVKMTRDAMSRAIMMEILEGRSSDGNHLTLDITPIPEARLEKLRVLLPKNASKDQRHFNIGLQSHYFMGGAKIDERTATCVDRLYCAGEICAGVNGANRLGGNALAETFVFGKISGENAAKQALTGKTGPPDPRQISAETERLRKMTTAAGGESVKELRRLLRSSMWNRAGIIRNEDGLNRALGEIASLKTRLRNISINSPGELADALRLENMIVVSEMVAKCALLRTESRGSHYRTDYPHENQADWLKNTVITKKDDKMSLETVPVDLSRMSP
jgi:fumarate reductase (CoM/CoB) subunit A